MDWLAHLGALQLGCTSFDLRNLFFELFLAYKDDQSHNVENGCSGELVLLLSFRRRYFHFPRDNDLGSTFVGRGNPDRIGSRCD